MKYRSFLNFMSTVQNSIDATNNEHPEKEKTIFINNGKWALAYLEKDFDDKEQNLRRWLNRKDCRFVDRQTQKINEVKIGNDLEALYYFLIYCKEVHAGREVSDDFCDYMNMLIIESVCYADNR